MSELQKGRILANKVLLKKVEKEEKTASGIIIAEIAQKEKYIGEVVKIGLDVRACDLGHLVHYDKHAGVPLVIENVDYLLISENECLYIE